MDVSARVGDSQEIEDNLRGPLQDIRILDLGRYLAGPSCAMWLADLGADVIKLEPPGKGEKGRASGPPFLGGESAFFLSANRNKRSLALDIKTSQGQAVFKRLAQSADVVIENFRPGVMEALNLGYPKISVSNPRLIYASISGFGDRGPLAKRAGLDHIIQGFSGLMSLTGFEGQEPVRVGVPIADLVTGLFAAYAILGALQARQKTGRGQEIKTSLLESMSSMLVFQAVRYLNGAGVPPPAGNHHPIIAPYGVFRAQDGYLILGATDEKAWERLCQVLGAQELIQDQRFRSNGDRYEHRDQLAQELNRYLKCQTVGHWETLLEDSRIPCGPVLGLDAAMDHPQLKALDMIVECPHPPQDAPLRLLGSPVRLSDTPAEVYRRPPRVGEHTLEILTELGLSPEEIEALIQSNVVGHPETT